jgi:hypothetical protein
MTFQIRVAAGAPELAAAVRAAAVLVAVVQTAVLAAGLREVEIVAVGLAVALEAVGTVVDVHAGEIGQIAVVEALRRCRRGCQPGSAN